MFARILQVHLRVRKARWLMLGGTLLAMGWVDQPRRGVPPFWETSLAPGALGRFVIREEGDLTLKFVTARLGRRELELVPVPSSHGLGHRTRSVAEIARRFSVQTKRPVLAAINGGFFDVATGLPIGFLLRDGRMEFFNMPQGYQRSMVGFGLPARSGQKAYVWISSPRQMPKAWLDAFTAGRGQPVKTATLAVHHINVPGGKNALALFTSAYLVALKLPEKALYGIARAEPGHSGVYRIVGTHRHGRLVVPQGGIVIALHGNALAYARWLAPETLVRPRWTLPPEWRPDHVTHGLLAGPRLLERGRIQVTAKEERLDAVKSPDRVALGVKPNGEVLLVWLHKNNRGNLSFERVAEVLSGMGATEAIALDGGKSRAILAEVFQNSTRDRYFDGGRPVANALILTVPPS